MLAQPYYCFCQFISSDAIFSYFYVYTLVSGHFILSLLHFFVKLLWSCRWHKCCRASAGVMSVVKVKKKRVAITTAATTYTAGIAHDTHYHPVHTVPPTAGHELNLCIVVVVPMFHSVSFRIG